MSLTQDGGRTLPSVFSDIRNNAEVEKARKRIGALGMWIFVLLGIALAHGHAGRFDADHHLWARVGAWFWWLVAAVWLVLLATLLSF